MKGESDWSYGIELDDAYSSNLSTVTTASTEDEQPECEAWLKSPSPALSDPTFCSTLFSFAIGKPREAIVDKRRNVSQQTHVQKCKLNWIRHFVPDIFLDMCTIG